MCIRDSYLFVHFLQLPLFTALQLCKRGILISICPSVYLSVKRVDCDKTKALSKKVQLWLIGSRSRAFQWWTAYVAPNPQRGPQKRFFFIFRIKKLGFSFLKESLIQVSLFENFQRQSCKAFTGLSSRAQMVGGGPVSYTHLTLPTIYSV